MWIGPGLSLARNCANTSLVGSIWPIVAPRFLLTFLSLTCAAPAPNRALTSRLPTLKLRPLACRGTGCERRVADGVGEEKGRTQGAAIRTSLARGVAVVAGGPHPC